MNKFIGIILTLLLISGCDQLGSSRIKSLVELAPKLKVEKPEQIKFSEAMADPFGDPASKKLYTIAGKKIISEPAIAKKIFYSVDSKGYVNAYSLKENKILWRRDVKGDTHDRLFLGGGILYSEGKLYVTFGTRDLVVLDAETGFEEFRKEFSDILRSRPVMAAKNRLIVQTVGNQVFAINSKTFGVFWAHEGGLQTIATSKHIGPSLFQDKVIVNYSTGDIFCLNLSDGQPVWKYTLTGKDGISLPGFVPFTTQTQPIIYDDFMYFASTSGKLVKLYLYTGLPAWTVEAHDVQTMTLHQNSLIITNNARQVAVLNPDSGNVAWVGNLISEEGSKKRKIKPANFMAPFVSKNPESGVYSINVAADNSELYRFKLEGGNPNQWPETRKIHKKARYQWFSCCSGHVHFVIDRILTE